MKCEHTDKGDGFVFCEHCHQMGRKRDVEKACPYKEKPKIRCPFTGREITIPFGCPGLGEPMGTGGWG